MSQPVRWRTVHLVGQRAFVEAACTINTAGSEASFNEREAWEALCDATRKLTELRDLARAAMLRAESRPY